MNTIDTNYLYFISTVEAKEIPSDQLPDVILSLLVDPVATTARIAFLKALQHRARQNVQSNTADGSRSGEAESTTSADNRCEYDAEVRALREFGPVECVLLGRISESRLRGLANDAVALQQAAAICQPEMEPAHLPALETPLAVQIWSPFVNWREGIHQSAAALILYLETVSDRLAEAVQWSLSPKPLAVDGLGASHDPFAAESESTATPGILLTRDNHLVLDMTQDQAPYGIGLIYLHDNTEDQRLVALQPVLLWDSAEGYHADLALADLCSALPERYTAHFVPARVATRELFTSQMLDALRELASTDDQVQRIEQLRQTSSSR